MTGVVLNVSALQDTLVQYIEVWQLSDDRQTMFLENHARLRGSVVGSGTSERSVRSGEGMAGMAWNRRCAVILQESPSELLQRIGTQIGLELTALIACPIMHGHEVLSVVVFGIIDGSGAFEVWSRDDRDELSISASYYSGLKSLEFMSRYVRFPKGAGLPGAVWKTGEPKLALNLASSPAFMRSFDAEEAQPDTGLGLPVGSVAGHAESILLLLSVREKPIASVFEIWVRNSAAEFECVTADWSAVCGDGESLQHEYQDAVKSAWVTGRPVLFTDVLPVRLLRSTEVESLTIRAVLAMPIYRAREQVAVVIFMF